MVIKKLKPNMIVYDVRPTTGLQRFNGRWSTYPVTIIQIDEEEERIFASWNHNKPSWYQKRTWSKWRMKVPTED